MKTLICILAQTRSWELTWDRFKKFLHRDNDADICLAIGVDDNYNYNNPFYNNAKYKFLYKEPLDYGTAFDYALGVEGSSKNWRQVLKIKDQWLGGILDDKEAHPGSAGILIFYRWWLLHNIKQLNLTEKYDWFVVTRSDFFYEFEHPQTDIFNPYRIYIPEGEDYGGITDRHIVVHKKYLTESLDLMSPILTTPELLYEEMKNCHDWNLEKYIKHIFEKRGLNITRFPRMMYAVRGEKDNTRWMGGTYLDDAKMIVKYESEYRLAKATKGMHSLGYEYCAAENESFNFKEVSDVAYGAEGGFVYLPDKIGTVVFNNETFGGDPSPNKVKMGFYRTQRKAPGMKGIVVTTHIITKPFYEDFMKSIYGCKYPVVTVFNTDENNAYETAGLKAGMELFEDFIYLHDTVIIKDLELFNLLFKYPEMVSLSPRFLMFLGKYNSSILKACNIKDVKTKMESHDLEMWLGRAFSHAPCFDPTFIDGNHRMQEMHGRMNMVLENKYLIKMKGHWCVDMCLPVSPCK